MAPVHPLTAGDFGVDVSGFPLDPLRLDRDGGTFVLRYSAGAGNADSRTQWKLCRPGEIQACVAAGIHFVANSEWTTDRITQGYSAGLADGRADRKFWRSRGLHRGAVIYVSYDADPVRSSWDATAAYLRGYKKGLKPRATSLRPYYRVGAYGGTPWLRELKARKLIAKAWRSNAGAWSDDGLPYQPQNAVANAHALVRLGRAATGGDVDIWQTGNYWYGNQADENLLLNADIGSHQQNPPRRPKPVPAPPPVPIPVPRPVPKPPVPTVPSRAELQAMVAQLAARVTVLEQEVLGK